jgi:hypothetical protein
MSSSPLDSWLDAPSMSAPPFIAAGSVLTGKTKRPREEGTRTGSRGTRTGKRDSETKRREADRGL